MEERTESIASRNRFAHERLSRSGWRYRDLTVKCDALQEEVTTLRFAARNAASSWWSSQHSTIYLRFHY
jgi:hypothetical protein